MHFQMENKPGILVHGAIQPFKSAIVLAKGRPDKRDVPGIGAPGAIYGVRVLETLAAMPDVEVHLIFTEAAKTLVPQELLGTHTTSGSIGTTHTHTASGPRAGCSR